MTSALVSGRGALDSAAGVGLWSGLLSIGRPWPQKGRGTDGGHAQNAAHCLSLVTNPRQLLSEHGGWAPGATPTFLGSLGSHRGLTNSMASSGESPVIVFIGPALNSLAHAGGVGYAFLVDPRTSR
jgi:hypothetical protein